MIQALIQKELLALRRDLHGLAALFLMPMVFIIVMSMALKDVYTFKPQHLSYAVLDQDQSPLSAQWRQNWHQESGDTLHALPQDWRTALQAGQLSYVLQIDKNFAQHWQGSDNTTQATSAYLHLWAEPGMQQQALTSLQTRATALNARLQWDTLRAQLPPSLRQPAAAAPSITIARSASHLKPSAVQQNVPAWLVFGMFFVVSSIAGLVVEERNCGALARLYSYGVAPWQIVLSKVLPYLAVNAIQAALMLAVGVGLMPIIGGEGLTLNGVDGYALVCMLLAISIAAVGLALAIASLVRSHAQASTLGPILNVLMAALGGIMVPTFVMPSVMQTIAQYSPMHWSLEGLLSVLLRGGDLFAIASYVAQLCCFGLLMLSLAYILLRFQR